MSPKLNPWPVVVGSVLMLALFSACHSDSPTDPLTAAGIPVTTGAAAGYVPDAVCGGCHGDLASSFSEVGMARSFYAPSAERLIEDFAAEPLFHPASQRWYRMRRDGERLLFERWQLDSQDRRIHSVELEVDWILGSGHTSRTYLFQTPEGELYQLPIAWYSQSNSWQMAPGFDKADHLGLQRLVRRECMFCHNAYPEAEAGSDLDHQAHLFPSELPEGIGCQRCHGPGAEHVAAAMEGRGEQIQSTIVNPAGLSPELGRDICYGCHFQPSVALMGVSRFGRAAYSFRPGEDLDDFRAQIDVVEQDQPREDRFEINHHPYRLEQSACFQASAPGTLGCTSCHDPHRKVAVDQVQAHYRQVCLSCHGADSCTVDPAFASKPRDQCVSCHMPKRRTQDVVHVAMTDHKIQRRAPENALAPLEESTPVLVDAELLAPESLGALVPIYRASAVIRAGGSSAAGDFLLANLPDLPKQHAEPWSDLVKSLLAQGRFAEADEMASRALDAWPDFHLMRSWRAVARIQLARPREALADLDQCLQQGGERADVLFNRGLLYEGLARFEEAAVDLKRALELRPNLPRAWAARGRTLEALGQPQEAESAYRQSLAWDPTSHRAAIDLGRLLQASERSDEAGRVLEHAVVHGRDKKLAAQAFFAAKAGRPIPTSTAGPTQSFEGADVKDK